MSTFGGLDTAYTGLTAAQQALDVTGQNITNAGTQGYTRQRLQVTSAPAPALVGPATLGSAQPGQGVIVTGVERLTDELVNARVRSATAASASATTQSATLTTLEDSFNEPSNNGLSAQFQKFWSSWQDLSNTPSDASAGQSVIATGQALVQQIATGYSNAADQWSQLRGQVDSFADQVNIAADQIAKLNSVIQQTIASGGSANELKDQRDLLTTQVAQLAGGTVTPNADGTVNVLLDGNLLVDSVTANHVQAIGAGDVSGASGSPVQLQWASSGQVIGIDSGQIAGALALLAPANGAGTGGALAETAAGYNNLANQLAGQVNGIVTTGQTNTGALAGAFFAIDPTRPAAVGLSVAITSGTQIGTAAAGALSYDGSLADRVSQIGASAASPDAQWSQLVAKVATASQSASRLETLTSSTLTSATAVQASNSSVSTDQEGIDMVTEQAAYQAAARVMTTVDQLLDTLINHTGVVGIA